MLMNECPVIQVYVQENTEQNTQGLGSSEQEQNFDDAESASFDPQPKPQDTVSDEAHQGTGEEKINLEAETAQEFEEPSADVVDNIGHRQDAAVEADLGHVDPSDHRDEFVDEHRNNFTQDADTIPVGDVDGGVEETEQEETALNVEGGHDDDEGPPNQTSLEASGSQPEGSFQPLHDVNADSEETGYHTPRPSESCRETSNKIGRSIFCLLKSLSNDCIGR
jgi:hypothetical protein